MSWGDDGDGPGTWLVHAAAAILVPRVLRILVLRYGLPLPADLGTLSLFVLAFFIGKEVFDWRRKAAAGVWGERWRRDLAGDLLGPVTATLCYL